MFEKLISKDLMDSDINDIFLYLSLLKSMLEIFWLFKLIVNYITFKL